MVIEIGVAIIVIIIILEEKLKIIEILLMVPVTDNSGNFRDNDNNRESFRNGRKLHVRIGIYS